MASAHFSGEIVPIADFGHLPTQCRFLALMPQWDFLNFLAARATARYPAFRLWMRADVTDLIEEGGRIVGLRVTTEPAQQLRPRHREEMVTIQLGPAVELLHEAETELDLSRHGEGHRPVELHHG